MVPWLLYMTCIVSFEIENTYKLQYLNEIKFVLCLSQVYFYYFIVSNVGN